MRLRVKWAVILVTIFLTHSVIWNNLSVDLNENLSQDPYIYPPEQGKNRIDQATLVGNKTILMWTKYFNSYFAWISFYGFATKSCANRCNFIFNRSLLHEADAVVMNSRDIYINPTDFPPQRSPNQIWIFHNTECPTKTYLSLTPYKNVFNWTSTVRADSDVQAVYGKTTRGNLRDNLLIRQNSLYKNKTLGVAFVASNCYSDNAREAYVRELQKYIPVDVYGKCGPLKCPGGWTDTHKCLSKYKFYLAFENSNCRDYITEKLWRTYTMGSIPVVRGGANYSKFAPPDSYINTADFKSPKELAAFLLEIGNSEEKYMRYMEWHHTHKLLIREGQYWCDLCQALHKKSGKHQIYRDLEKWASNDTCYTSRMSDWLVSFLSPLKGQLDLGWYR